MVSFFDLPRELRDLIYTEVVVGERPRPILGHPQWRSFRFQRVSYPRSGDTGEFGCAYSLEPVPPTCANFLCCSRQIHEEMLDAIQLAKKKEGSSALSARVDCIAEDESFHYFTWLSVPIVQTRPLENQALYAILDNNDSILPRWAQVWLSQYMEWTWARWILRTRGLRFTTTHIEKLCIDVRPSGDRTRKWTRNNSQSDRTSWAICAALKRLLEHGPDFISSTSSTTAPPLTLNVIPPQDYPTSKYLPADAQGNEVREGLVHPHSVAKELLDVWAKIWRGEESKSFVYQGLLERIGRVQVCVESKVWGKRPLGDELRRGRRFPR
ncbi:hypothetical protein DM02DRAFT_514798 [Periconia macrospinosa]|uniref:Uncharacterized protein n=1 Tax=Periconia macrospinosa TaxID=97972 RepID=A0A2V1E6X0_9PLEO|nr:hypothetical protein DM02DRAFT_514798 [Periconia macrospinosa]